MKEELEKLVEVLNKVTGGATVAVCIYLIRSVASDLIIVSGAVAAVYLITRIWC